MQKKRHTYIFVVGGVMSGVGKGVASSSIGALLQSYGLTVTAIKIDPYINVDAGTMNPTEHGEVFVLQNGLETDQDMGNYERFLNTDIPDWNYMTTGSVYQELIRRERNLEFKGRNVEVVPDVPLEVIRRIQYAAQQAQADVTLVEIGGTIGEYQNIIFLEAARMMKFQSPDDVFITMVSYLPVPSSLGEMKTKPTQYASRTLNSVGLHADAIIARSVMPLDTKRKEKLALFCNVPVSAIISAPDVSSIYDVPLNFARDGLGDYIIKKLALRPKRTTPDLARWKRFNTQSRKTDPTVHIAVVGKYFTSGGFMLADVYISLLEALKHASYAQKVHPVIHYFQAQDFEGAGKSAALKKLAACDGVLVPGGFGTTGVAGKLAVIQYAREHKIPYFGICYGMQLAVIEYARNVAHIKNADTRENNPRATHCVIDTMESQKDALAQGIYGGTMRLGTYPATLRANTIAARAYKTRSIHERHRHRYEVNSAYVSQLQDAGLVFSGTSPDGLLMESIELPTSVHPHFVGVQFHPEFLSRPFAPHPLFVSFVKAMQKQHKPKKRRA